MGGVGSWRDSQVRQLKDDGEICNKKGWGGREG
jgi:hypothetical protein